MGTLFIVSTPIGNLKDITIRAKEVLRQTEYLACEDTRRAGLLLKTIEGNKSPVLLSYFEGNEERRIPQIINLLENGKNVTLISDAGTPLISDPGFKLVRECGNLGIKVEAVPGPSSVITALTVSGLPTDKFLFLGYPPVKEGKRKKQYEILKNEEISKTVILFEAPHKLLRTLNEILQAFGDIEIVICRELTKIYEEVRKENVSESIRHFSEIEPKGEFIILFHK